MFRVGTLALGAPMLAESGVALRDVGNGGKAQSKFEEASSGEGGSYGRGNGLVVDLNTGRGDFDWLWGVMGEGLRE